MEQNLVDDDELEMLPVVANCTMNRERRLRGADGYEHELHLDCVEFLTTAAQLRGTASWLDLCCGSGTALVEAANEVSGSSLDFSIVGLDLVDHFVVNGSADLTFVTGSALRWQPQQRFDLVTCVHGLHYVGDKLGLLARAIGWLSSGGKLVANFDSSSVVVDGGTPRTLLTSLRNAGLTYDSRRKLLTAENDPEASFRYIYLGADPNAGPNYTGQPAVASYYRVDCR